MSNLRDPRFERLWRRLQELGLNGYEARTYMVLHGRARSKALDVATRAEVPRQKIYEVLDSLAEKGFVQLIQEKTKLFSAIEPGLAVPAYVEMRQKQLEAELAERGRAAVALVEELNSSHSEGLSGRGTLDYLRIIADPDQTAAQYRRLISNAEFEYLEFSRPPYAVDPLEEKLVRDARQRGVACRLLLEPHNLDPADLARLAEYEQVGVEVRQSATLPMKLALFDGKRGMIALLDPSFARPTWTAILFEHPGMAEAMKGLFEDYWKRAERAQA